MAYANVAEAEKRISELEKENGELTAENRQRVKMETQYRKERDAFSSFLKEQGFDPSGDLEEQWGSIVGKMKNELTKKEKEGKKSSDEVAELRKTLEQVIQERDEGKISSAMDEHFKDVIGGTSEKELWIAKKKVKLVEGKVVFAEGDKETPIKDAIESWKKANPERIKMNQQSGGGSNGGSSEGGERKPKRMKQSEFNKTYKTDNEKLAALDTGLELDPD